MPADHVVSPGERGRLFNSTMAFNLHLEPVFEMVRQNDKRRFGSLKILDGSWRNKSSPAVS